jgi:predicted transcriptional regulator
MRTLKKTHVKFDEDLRRLLETLAARHHISKSDVLRLALQAFAERQGLTLPLATREEDHMPDAEQGPRL